MPLAYVRLLELAEGAGASFVAGSRWLDFGFGAPGQLQMLARMGLDVVGVDIGPVGAATYPGPSDVAVTAGSDIALKAGGNITLEATGDILIKSGGLIEIKAGAPVTIDGAFVKVQGGVIKLNS